MSTRMGSKQSLDMLDQVLDAYGANPDRWPADARAVLVPLLAADTEAQRRLAEARAFDRLLDHAQGFDAARHAALVDGIVARAERQPRVAAEAMPQRDPVAMRPRRHTLAGAALAASLVLGVLAGQNATVGSVASALVTGGEANSAAGQQYALGDEVFTLLDEDLL